MEPSPEFVAAPPGTWVIRGGDLVFEDVKKNAEDCYEDYGTWGLCVTALPNASLGETVSLVPFANHKLRPALSEELTAGGWVVINEPGLWWPSGLLTFPNGEPNSTEVDRLREVFMAREYVPNPKPRTKRVR